jgi:hypothetical protein
MRPRFSVRLLLIVFAVLAVVCYVLLARPTLMAERFASAVNNRDYGAAHSLLRDQRFWRRSSFFAIYTPQSATPTSKTVLIYAEVLPREWSDIWSFQRRLIFRVALVDDNDGRHVEWTEDTEMVAHIDGLEVVTR